MTSPSDEIRNNIMRILYEIHKKSRSPNSIPKGIKDLCKTLKNEFGYKQNEVSHNLDFLVQRGWVAEIVIKKTFTKNLLSREQSQKKYKISDIGIEKYEEASTFHSSRLKPTINVTNINGVTVVGDGNIVNTKYTDLVNVLDQLKQQINQSNKINDTKKLESIADIETIQSQLEKPNPNKSVIKTLFSPLEKIANLGGLISIFDKAKELISPLISG